MVHVHIELENTENRILELYQTKYGLKNKQEAVEHLINSVKPLFSEEDISADWRIQPASEKQLFKLKELGIRFDKKITKGEAFQVIRENLE